jgi:hypothetical protein
MRINPYRRLYIALAAITLLACNTGAPQPAANSTHSNLKTYFETEARLLLQNGLQLHKSVVLNGQRDSITLSPDSTGLQHLLKPFTDADVNKPSLRDAYRADTIPDLISGNSTVMYTARNAATSPQQVILNLDRQGHITAVNIHKSTRNLVYEYQQHLFYQHLKTIRITTFQKIAFLKPRELDVKVWLAPKN